MAMTHETERAAIVRWLRAQSDTANGRAESAVAVNNDRLARDYFAAKISIARAADAIERGDHIKETSDDN